MRRMLKWARRANNRASSIILLVLLWELVARSMNNTLFLPPFSEVVYATWKALLSGELLEHIGVSMVRALTGFTLAVLVGVPLGLLMGWFKKWEDFCSPLISLAYPIPKIGLIPLFILWLGIGNSSKVAVIFTACIFSVILNTYTGVKGTPRHLVWSALSMGASSREVLLKVVLPHSLPYIFAGLRLAMGIAWILLFAAEMVAARSGLGFLILYAERMLQTEVVFMALLTIAFFGFIFDRLILVGSRKACDWYFEFKEGEA